MSSLHGVLNCLIFFTFIFAVYSRGWGLSCKPITLILYSNFEIFVTVVTGTVGLSPVVFGLSSSVFF